MYSKIKEILKDAILLLVEDDDDLRETIKSALQNYVSEIYACKDGKDGLEIFTKKPINLILSDINMPRVNGLKMAQMIRQSDPNVPILFLTGFDSDENVLGALEIAGSGILRKPFDKRELVMSLSFAANKFKSDFANVDLKNGFKFNAFTRELTKDAKSVKLTKKEQNLLHLLIKNSGKTVSFEMIESHVWSGQGCTSEMIRAFVYKLRKKIYADLIQNAQGMGYKINLNDENLRTVNSIKYI